MANDLRLSVISRIQYTGGRQYLECTLALHTAEVLRTIESCEKSEATHGHVTSGLQGRDSVLPDCLQASSSELRLNRSEKHQETPSACVMEAPSHGPNECAASKSLGPNTHSRCCQHEALSSATLQHNRHDRLNAQSQTVFMPSAQIRCDVSKDASESDDAQQYRRGDISSVHVGTIENFVPEQHSLGPSENLDSVESLSISLIGKSLNILIASVHLEGRKSFGLGRRKGRFPFLNSASNEIAGKLPVRDEAQDQERSTVTQPFTWNRIEGTLNNLLHDQFPASTPKDNSGITASDVPYFQTPPAILCVDTKFGWRTIKASVYRQLIPPQLCPTYSSNRLSIYYYLVITIQKAPIHGQVHQIQHVRCPIRLIFSQKSPKHTLHNSQDPLTSKDQRSRDKVPEGPYITEIFPSHFAREGPKTGFDAFLLHLRRLLQGSDSHTSAKPAVDNDHNHFGTSSPDIRPSKCGHSIDANPLRFQLCKSGHTLLAVKLDQYMYRAGDNIRVTIESCDPLPPVSTVNLRLIAVTHPVWSENESQNLTPPQPTEIVAMYQTKIFCTHSCQRAVIALNVPKSATPNFMVDGISVQWRLRLDLTRSKIGSSELPGRLADDHNIIEVERGTLIVARPSDECEKYSVTLPIEIAPSCEKAPVSISFAL